MAWISAVFFCLGAADTLLGDRLGLGSAFRQGFAAVVDLLLLMTGFMALAPWLGTHLAPVITPVFSAVGCDPSLFASLFLSCDAGGAVLAAQIAQEPSAGLYNGLIVAAFLGATINGTIPLALGRLTGTNKKTDRKNSEIAGAFCGDLDHIPIPVVPVFRRSSPAFFIALHYSSHFLPIYEKKATFR